MTSLQRRKFTPEEDEELQRQVKLFGPKGWDLIAKFMPNRTAKQCRDRYMNYLAPNFFYGEWSKEEDQLIINFVNEIGPQWSLIARKLQNRTSNSVKNRAKYLEKFMNAPINIQPFLKNRPLTQDIHHIQKESEIVNQVIQQEILVPAIIYVPMIYSV